MPVLDGLSATRLIREGERRAGTAPIPIIAVTANAFDSDKLATRDAGMDDHLAKPFTSEELAAVLGAWCRLQPQQRSGASRQPAAA